MAAASASAQWSGRGSCSRWSSALTMYWTWPFSAAPVPATACLICMGVYSPMTRSHDEHATRAAPRAWAVAMALWVFAQRKTSSTATSWGP